MLGTPKRYIFSFLEFLVRICVKSKIPMVERNQLSTHQFNSLQSLPGSWQETRQIRIN
jgi:hypothetical protein